jgi:hypothetical protein
VFVSSGIALYFRPPCNHFESTMGRNFALGRRCYERFNETCNEVGFSHLQSCARAFHALSQM